MGRYFWIGFGVLGLLLVTGGVTYKSFIQPTSKTVIGQGGRQIFISNEVPKTRLFNFGCSNAEVEGYWKKNRPLPLFNQTDEKK